MTVRYLKNAKISHVSYVDKGANKKQFFMTKSAAKPNLEKVVTTLFKEDDEKQLVYGVVYEPEVVDAHGDAMTEAEIEKAAHYFMSEARKIDKQHDFQEGYGEVVESYVAPADFEYGGETIKKGSWVLVTKATDEVWESIKKGEITGYSMAGVAEVEEVEDVNKQEDRLVDKITKAVSKLFTKGQVKDTFYQNRLNRDIRSAFYIFEDILYEQFLWSSNPDPQVIIDGARDLAELFEELANSSDIIKSLGGVEGAQAMLLSNPTKTTQETRKADTEAGNNEITKVNEEEVEMNEKIKKALQDVVKEAVKPLEDKLSELEGKVEKSDEAADKKVEKADEKVEDLKKELGSVVAEALKPLNDRLDKVEKARGIQKSDEEVVTKSKEDDEDDIWKGLL